MNVSAKLFHWCTSKQIYSYLYKSIPFASVRLPPLLNLPLTESRLRVGTALSTRPNAATIPTQRKLSVRHIQSVCELSTRRTTATDLAAAFHDAIAVSAEGERLIRSLLQV